MDTSYVISPLTPENADELRRVGGEVYVADEHPGYPCRQCLQDAQLGEELILVSHDPFNSDSPYRSASPIFIHRESCGGPETDDLPPQLTMRQLSVRAFDDAETMVDARVIDGSDLDATLKTFFADAETDRVHVHNATRGCWATIVRRPD